MMNFNDALNTKQSEIERPPLLPSGTYRAVVTKVPALDKRGEYEVCDFQLKMLEAQEDVDPDALTEYGGLGPTAVARRSFMFNSNDEAAFKRTLFDLKRFLLDHLQVAGDDNTTLKELLNSSVNAQCLAFIRWRPDKNDPEIQYVEVAKTAPIA